MDTKINRQNRAHPFRDRKGLSWLQIDKVKNKKTKNCEFARFAVKWTYVTWIQSLGTDPSSPNLSQKKLSWFRNKERFAIITKPAHFAIELNSTNFKCLQTVASLHTTVGQNELTSLRSKPSSAFRDRNALKGLLNVTFVTFDKWQLHSQKFNDNSQILQG